MSINQNIIAISNQLRKLSEEVEDVRTKYNDEVQKHAITKRLLNSILRELKEFKVPSDIHKDLTLMFDCVMMKTSGLDDDQLEFFYSLSELERQIKDFEGSNPYDKMMDKLNTYKKKYEVE